MRIVNAIRRIVQAHESVREASGQKFAAEMAVANLESAAKRSESDEDRAFFESLAKAVSEQILGKSAGRTVAPYQYRPLPIGYSVSIVEMFPCLAEEQGVESTSPEMV